MKSWGKKSKKICELFPQQYNVHHVESMVLTVYSSYISVRYQFAWIVFMVIVRPIYPIQILVLIIHEKTDKVYNNNRDLLVRTIGSEGEGDKAA
jgi:hypothetical protein